MPQRDGVTITKTESKRQRLFLEDELHEGSVEVVSDVLVLLLLRNKLVCTFDTPLHNLFNRILAGTKQNNVYHFSFP